MSKLYLSPSTQEFNQYVTSGNEELYANAIADAMVPYLRASNIEFDRNDPSGKVTDSVAKSNEQNYDFHLAIHSNAAPERLSGQIRGSDVYYYKGSDKGQAAATVFANNLKEIYPLPNMVGTVPTTSLFELRKTIAPAVLVELAYHDNVDDANWITGNIDSIAKNLSISVADVLDVPFVDPFAI